MHRRHFMSLLAVVASASLVLAGQAASGRTTSTLRPADDAQSRIVSLGDHDRVLLTTLGDSGRTAVSPLPGADGTTPGVFITSTYDSTSVQAADSHDAPILVAGRARTRMAARTDDLVELHFDAIARDGRAGIAHVNVFDLETGAVATRELPGDPDAGCTSETYAVSDCILVPAGAYSVMAFVTTMPAGQSSTDSGGRTVQNVSLVGTPETHVSGPRDFVFDARKARRLTVSTPGHRTKVNAEGAMLLGYRRTALNGQAFTAALRPSYLLDNSFYLQPTAHVSTGGLETLTRVRLEAPDIELSVRGRALHPEYYDSVWFSDTASEFPMYDGHARLRVADVGHATPADLAGRHLRGAVAVVERSDDLSVAEQSNAAAAAGASLVVVYNDGPGDNGDPNGSGVRLDVPTLRLDHAEGVALTRLRHGGRVDVRGEPASPYLYDLLIKERGRIPRDLHYRYRSSRLATQVRALHGQPTTGSTFSEAAYEYQPGDTFSISTMYPFRDGPRTRTEYRIPDRDTRWTYAVSSPELSYNAMFPHPPVLEMILSDPHLVSYRARQRDTLPVAAAPIAPAPNPAVPMQRAGDLMRLQIDGFTDADGNHGTAYSTDSGMSTHLEIRADGELVAETDNLPSGTVQLPAGDSRVEVEFDTENPQDWNRISTRTETTWTFASSSTPDGEVVTEPVLVPDYDVEVDLHNRVHAHGHRVGFDLDLAHAAGSAGAPISAVRLAASYDDGASWQPARISRSRAGWHVVLPRGSGFVSLRLHAADTAGSVVDQTIVRAFDAVR